MSILHSKFQSSRAQGRPLQGSDVHQIIEFIQAAELELYPIAPGFDLYLNVMVSNHPAPVGIGVAQRNLNLRGRGAACPVDGPDSGPRRPTVNRVNLASEGLRLSICVSLNLKQELGLLIAPILDHDIERQSLVLLNVHGFA